MHQPAEAITGVVGRRPAKGVERRELDRELLRPLERPINGIGDRLRIRGTTIMSRLLVLCCVVLFANTGCQRAASPPVGPVEGVWLLNEVRLTGPEGVSVDEQPLPGLYTFTREHYSIVRMVGDQLPPDNARIWFPTMAEKARQHDAIIVNAGTYELGDSILTTHPMAAKTPEFIGGRTLYAWKIAADSLWLTTLDIRSRDDVQDPFVSNYRLVIKLVRAE